MGIENHATVVGINNYPDAPLTGCEADARAIKKALATHADGLKNFKVDLLLSSKQLVSKGAIVRAFRKAFSSRDARIVLFYFSGHGELTSDGGFLVTQDAMEGDEGVPMAQLIAAANSSPASERIIVLDCCNSGSIGQFYGSLSSIALEEGVSILAACRTEQSAMETNGRGDFTRLICDALDGGAADVRGNVNVAGLYSYVDEVMSVTQRPLFKTNISKLVPIKRAHASISDEKLRCITEYFPSSDYVYKLDPSYEPTAEPNCPAHEAIFADLQRFRGARLLVPNGEDHLYWAAMNKKSCSLTALGKFYWEQVKAENI
ncbi:MULTISPECIES: caspase family protein [Bradyrhizobium]|uniref:caspase family protein n=1 Tax=Bradyrhizobium TaxID=374 RepID=UPI0004861BE5|nr:MULTISPECIES: caspase family protein [Bradyrhizobium]UFW51099.1 caspase family protein [Bradyrhizobium arachidis]